MSGFLWDEPTPVVEQDDPGAPPFPLVNEHDPCVQHDGTPRTCYACNAMIGFPHRTFCSYVVVKIRVRIDGAECERYVPWCFSRNQIEMLHQDYRFWEFVETVDATPILAHQAWRKGQAA